MPEDNRAENSSSSVSTAQRKRGPADPHVPRPNTSPPARAPSTPRYASYIPSS